MALRRFVLVITDELGSHRGRLTITTQSLRYVALSGLVLAIVVLVMVAHGATARAQLEQASGLEARNRAMAALATTLGQQKQAVGRIVEENHRALQLLSRKSHVSTAVHQEANADDTDALLLAQTASVDDAVVVPARWHEPAVGEALIAHTDALLAQGLELEGSLADLLEYWRDAEQRLTYTPSVRPARSPWATSSYGVRIDPVFHYWVMHKGLDLGGFIGMLIYAPADGIVIWTGTRGGYGQTVVIDHGMGLQTHYAHLSKYMVRKGDVIRRGDPIAEMGSTGKSTGPHLHYEVRQDGVPMDPRQFILD